MRAPLRSHARRARGFTLVSVLVALVVSGLGVLAIVRLVTTATAASTQNQAIGQITSLGNSFWGVVQANPSLITTSAFNGTYTSANYTSAPTALQSWLSDALVGSTTQPGIRPPLPTGTSITIATGVDPNGNACSLTNGCTVTLTFQWTQAAAQGTSASTRSQVLYFQFPA
jgi:Tfp pilus assembly protein PilV